MSPNELYSEIDRLNRELTASQTEVERLTRERDEERAVSEQRGRAADAAVSAKEKAEADLCIALNDAKTIIAKCGVAGAAIAEEREQRREIDAYYVKATVRGNKAEVRAEQAEKDRDQLRGMHADESQRRECAEVERDDALDGLKRAREALLRVKRWHDNPLSSVPSLAAILDAAFSSAPPEAQGCDEPPIACACACGSCAYASRILAVEGKARCDHGFGLVEDDGWNCGGDFYKQAATATPPPARETTPDFTIGFRNACTAWGMPLRMGIETVRGLYGHRRRVVVYWPKENQRLGEYPYGEDAKPTDDELKTILVAIQLEWDALAAQKEGT